MFSSISLWLFLTIGSLLSEIRSPFPSLPVFWNRQSCLQYNFSRMLRRLTAVWERERGGKMRDPGNEVEFLVSLSSIRPRAKLSNRITFHLLSNRRTTETDLIATYFGLGLAYTEILSFLARFHGFCISLRQLKKVLRSKGLCRRKRFTCFLETTCFCNHL